MQENNEVWKDVKGFERYQVSDQGRVRSKKSNSKILKPTEDGIVRLYLGGLSHSFRVSFLVAQTFHGYIKGKGKVTFKNGNRKDWRSENIYVYMAGVRYEHRIIVTGCRNFRDYPLLASEVDFVIARLGGADEVEIISGGQCSVEKDIIKGKTERFGAERLGEVYADANRIPKAIIRYDWSKNQGMAKMVQIDEMVKYATHMIAFPSSGSRNTRDMITAAGKMGVRVYVIEV